MKEGPGCNHSRDKVHGEAWQATQLLLTSLRYFCTLAWTHARTHVCMSSPTKSITSSLNYFLFFPSPLCCSLKLISPTYNGEELAGCPSSIS